MRKQPQQDRSRKRVDRMLDAAAHEFAAVGVDAATTHAIAARAKVSIGSLYQFFPNKEALFDGLVRRYRDEATLLFESLMQVRPWELSVTQLVDQVVERVGEFYAERPGFQAVIARTQQSPELLFGSESLFRAFEETVAAGLSVVAPHLSAAERNLVATVGLAAGNGLIARAFKGDAHQARDIIAETKALLVIYLEAYQAGRRPSDATEERGKRGTRRQ